MKEIIDFAVNFVNTILNQLLLKFMSRKPWLKSVWVLLNVVLLLSFAKV